MERASAKVGEADQRKFRTIDKNRNLVDPFSVVFPILKFVDGKRELIGTGFFIARNGMFATAKHVLTDVLEENGRNKYPIFLVQFISSNECVLRPIDKGFLSPSADVAIGISAPMNLDKTGQPLLSKRVTLATTRPKVNDIVFTYAYPNTTTEVNGDHQTINFYPRYYEGKIVEYFDKGRDRVLLPSPCFQTSITSHGGASGGPVFNLNGSVCGINSTGFSGLPGISFISRIEDLFSLVITNVKIGPETAVRDVTIDELIRLGHILQRD